MKVALAVTAIGGALALAGHGADAGVRAALAVQLQPAPLIQAVDEAPPEDMSIDWTPDPWVSSPPAATNTCTSDTPGDPTCGSTGITTLPDTSSPGTDLMPSPAQLAQLQQDEQAAFDAVRPATPPRVIAKLDLGDGSQELLAAWHNSARDVCLDSEETDSYGGNGSNGPSGPCELAAMGVFAAQCTRLCAQILPPCDATLCVSSNDESSDGTHDYVLTGTVDASADEIYVTNAAGNVRAYPLTGPLIRESTLRVFMLQLGATDWRRFDLVAHGQVIESQQMPLLQVRSEECDAQVAPPDLGTWDATDPPDQAQLQAAMLAWLHRYDACLAAGGVDLGNDVIAAPTMNPPGTILTIGQGPTWTTGSETTAGPPTSP